MLHQSLNTRYTFSGRGGGVGGDAKQRIVEGLKGSSGDVILSPGFINIGPLV
jgi:hypothetical protein